MKTSLLRTTLAALLSTACSATRSVHQPPPIVFVHGFKGASLVDSRGKTVWLDAPTALGLRTPALGLPTAMVDGVQPQDGVRATEPLAKVSLIPGLIEAKVYQPFVQAMRRGPHAFHAFAYDWRRDNSESLAQLEAYVQAVRAEHGGAKVRLIAHSMGGLLGLALLHAHPEAFADVVFAGVPFAGGIGLLKELHAGDVVGRNREVLSPAVVASFPSAYSFFPEDGHGLVALDGSPLPMDFYDPACWRKYRLGMFAAGRHNPADPDNEILQAFLQQVLPKARAFRRRLCARPSLNYPPILVVSGQGQPALMTLVRQGPTSVCGWDFTQAPQEAGDGRVSLANSRPPAAIPHTVMTSDFGHAELLNDPAVICAVQAAKLPQP